MGNNGLGRVKLKLRQVADPKKAKLLRGFFKTGKGEYGEGDKFLGITVPVQRRIANEFADKLTLADLDKLIKSAVHEHRLAALLVLVRQFQKSKISNQQSEIYKFYLSHTPYINNWDLVDLSAPKIIGAYLNGLSPYSAKRGKATTILYKLAKSKNLWERRIAIVSTFDGICRGRPDDALKISAMLLGDSHDLIHKAAGWMLREAGKRCGESHLLKFLDKHYRRMPRTMLRYAIERLPESKRQHYLTK